MIRKNQHSKVTEIFSNIISDFDNFYNPRRRISLHVLFWTFLLSIYTIDLILVNSAFTINIAFVLAFRQIVQSIFAYYFICYLVIPKLLIPGKYTVGILALFIPFLFAPSVNYMVFIISSPLLLTDKVSLEYIKFGLFVNKIYSIFSLDEIILSLMPLILRTMPAFVMKLLVSTIHFFEKNNKQQRREHELERENLQLEINFLKSQMNPHFFFNTLNNIYCCVILKDDKAAGMIEDLSEIMQYTLYGTKDIFVPLEQELKFMEHYLALEKTRYDEKGGRINFNFDYTNTEGQMIAPLLLLPFLENAFKHGIRLNKKEGWLKATATVMNGNLFFCVENNKAKIISPHNESNLFQNENTGGIGVAGTMRRLSLLYPDKHELTIDDRENTYTISLKIKCKKDEQKITMPYS